MHSIPIAPGVLITALACCLAGLATPAAFADAAKDVDCRKCVNQSDIAPQAVTSGKLRNGAVREHHLGRDVRDRLDEIESRFDIVAVTWPRECRRPRIEHFRDAFEPPDRNGMFS